MIISLHPGQTDRNTTTLAAATKVAQFLFDKCASPIVGSDAFERAVTEMRTLVERLQKVYDKANADKADVNIDVEIVPGGYPKLVSPLL